MGTLKPSVEGTEGAKGVKGSKGSEGGREQRGGLNSLFTDLGPFSGIQSLFGDLAPFWRYGDLGHSGSFQGFRAFFGG